MKKQVLHFLNRIHGPLFGILLFCSLVATLLVCIHNLPRIAKQPVGHVVIAKERIVKYCSIEFAVKSPIIDGVDVVESINAYVNNNHWFCKALGIVTTTSQGEYMDLPHKRIDISTQETKASKYKIVLRPAVRNKKIGQAVEIFVDTQANTFSIASDSLGAPFRRSDYSQQYFGITKNGIGQPSYIYYVDPNPAIKTQEPLVLYRKGYPYHYVSAPLNVTFYSQILLYELGTAEYRAMTDEFDSSKYANRNCSNTTKPYCTAFTLEKISYPGKERYEVIDQLSHDTTVTKIENGGRTFYKQATSSLEWNTTYIWVHPYYNQYILISTNKSSEKIIEEEIIPSLDVSGSYMDTSYSEMPQDRKNFIDRFVAGENKGTYDELPQNNGGAIEQAKSAFKIKYFGDAVAAVAMPNFKGGSYLELYDIRSLEKTNTVMFWLSGNEIITKNYIVDMSDDGIIYYKKSERDYRVIASSTLANSKTETYGKYCGAGGCEYELHFDEDTKTVTATVFWKDFNGEKPNPRKRTVTFILE